MADLSPTLAERELALKERELDETIALRKHEIELRVQEMELQKRKDRISPLTIAVVTGVLTVLGAAVANVIQGRANQALEQRKAESALLLKAIETGDPDRAAKNLVFLAKLGLLSDPTGRIRALEQTPANAPVLPRTAPAFGPDTTVMPAGTYVKRENGRTVQAIVIHATETQEDLPSIVRFFKAGTRPASAHYVIGPHGEVVQLLREADVAFHAGPVIDQHFANPSSIGVELVHRTGEDYPAAQLEKLAQLLADIARRHKIDTSLIRTHAEVGAPLGRRRDGSDLDVNHVKKRVADVLRSPGN